MTSLFVLRNYTSELYLYGLPTEISVEYSDLVNRTYLPDLNSVSTDILLIDLFYDFSAYYDPDILAISGYEMLRGELELIIEKVASSEFLGKVVINTIPGIFYDFFPSLTTGAGLGPLDALDKLNRRIKQLASIHGWTVCDMEGGCRRAGSDAWLSVEKFDRFLFPLSSSGALASCDEVCAALWRAKNRSLKAVAVDLDNTLWGGVVGEDGPDNVGYQLPEHSRYRRLQTYLKALSGAGIPLYAVSKNNRHDVIECFEKNQMILRPTDFVEIYCGWGAKSNSISSILKALNILPESLLYIDDSEFEIEEINAAFPSVKTLLAAVENDTLKSIIDSRWFDFATITDEDLIRIQSFKNDKLRLKETAGMADRDFLKTLNLRCAVNSLIGDEKEVSSKQADLNRIEQLSNKTNQFNLTVDRLSVGKISNMLENGQKFVAFKLEDKFGPFGLVGYVNFCEDHEVCYINNIVLSCRAFGRRLEYFMLDHVLSILPSSVAKINLCCVRSEKNIPALEFFEGLACYTECSVDPLYKIFYRPDLSKALQRQYGGVFEQS